MNRIRSTIVGVMMVAMLAGCQARPVVVDNPLPIDAREYANVYHASIFVLRDMGFRVDRQDYRFGRVTTLPLDSPSMFEPWRPLNSTNEQVMQSTINQQRRTVAVMIERVEPVASEGEPPVDAAADQPAQPTAIAGSYQLRVEVIVEQLEMPINHLTGSASSNRIFNRLHATPDELAQRGITAMYWRTVERDVHLENRLVAEIVRRSVKIAVDPPRQVQVHQAAMNR